jgi:hypothetical protein
MDGVGRATRGLTGTGLPVKVMACCGVCRSRAVGQRRDWLVLACGVLSVASITGAPAAMTTAFDAIAVGAGAVAMYGRRRPRVAISA